MLDAAREAISFARDRTRNDLDMDRQLVLSLVKDIEIVGEAAARITESTDNRLPKSRGRKLSLCETGWFTDTLTSTST